MNKVNADMESVRKFLDEHPELPAQQREWYETMLSPEPLDPELVPYVDEDGPFGAMLKHPLVFDMTGVTFPGQANKQLRYKKAALAKAHERKDWNTVVYLHERPYRADALLALVRERGDEISDEDYWDLVGDVWVDSENIWQNEETWEELLGSDRPGREHMMDEEEQAALAALPDTLTVYRGCWAEVNEDGLSWTTDRAKAGWFAKRFADAHEQTPIVLVAEVDKANVVAHFLGRGESEVVVKDYYAYRVTGVEDPA
jgi:hypothetical protein